MSNRVTFDEALLDAKGDEDLMPTIERGLQEVQDAVGHIEGELTGKDAVLSNGDPVGLIHGLAQDLTSAAKTLDEYEPYLEHYQRLREHF